MVKFKRLLEAIGDDSIKLMQFQEEFGNVPDDEISSPETELALDEFAEKNNVSLLEYDISSLNLKAGTVLDLNDLEDVLNLTGGKFRKELALYLNDGGVISIKVVKNVSNTVNGIIVEVSAVDGDSQLADKSTILKFLKDKLENGDLSFLLEEEGNDGDMNLQPMSFEDMKNSLDPEVVNQLIENCGSQPMRQKMVEAETNGEEFEFSDEDKQVLTEAMKPFFETELADGMERKENVSQEELKTLLDGTSCSLQPMESHPDISTIYDDGQDGVVGLYNATTGSLDMKTKTKLQEGAESIAQQQLFGQAYAIRTGEQSKEGASEEVLKIVDGDMTDDQIKEFASTKQEGLPEKLTESEKVRVAKASSGAFRDALKGQGVDFSRVEITGANFDEFYINDKSTAEVKTLIEQIRNSGVPAVLVERIKEDGDGTQEEDETTKQEYSDILVENEDGEILMLQRTDNDTLEPSKFCFAGGKIEAGETPEEAGIRELEEETGIKVDALEPIKTFENEDGSSSHYFKTKINDDQFVKIGDEHQGIKWVKPEELTEMPDVIFNNNERFVEVCAMPMTESDNKIDIGTTVKDSDGKEWEAMEITDTGIKMKSGDEEKEVAFADVDTFLGKETEKLTESVKPKRIFRLKESVDEDVVAGEMEAGDFDSIEDKLEEADFDENDLELVGDAINSKGDENFEILAEATDGNIEVSLIKDSSTGESFLVESKRQ